MSLDFSRKAEDVVKKCVTPRRELQRHSKRTRSHWGIRTRVRITAESRDHKRVPLSTVPEDDRSGKTSISSLLA